MEFTRYYDPDVDVDGALSSSSEMLLYDNDHPESATLPIHYVGFVTSLGRFGLLKTYCIVPLNDGTLHFVHSKDLLACWGVTVFEASLHVYATSGPSYQDSRERGRLDSRRE